MRFFMIDEKLEKLKDILKSLESVVIAFSGGVDSTLLSKVAYDVLGDRSLAVTAKSETYTKSELDDAIELAKKIGIKHEIIETSELNIPEFSHNPIDRCYYCKRELLENLKEVAKLRGFKHVVDGANADDVGDYRPGMRAVAELNVRSPLKEAQLTKAEIRELSKRYDLPTWDKPSAACLASRFPYGTEITAERLNTVGEAEAFIKSFGISQLRVRFHDQIARIEVSDNDMEKLLKNRELVVKKLKELGFNYVTLDLQGYRTGSMNEVL
ncbi:TPA: ATP-dependent sacrificial sulfur transferase LarE [Candidatus Poribacteria bacterium]|nr:ATP-dependent sacrificial sulfur transferase LarE [Candidatus Poribacteria bacterium]